MSAAYSLHRIPFFDRLADSQTILLAGAGGGFDIYSGLPLYFSLRRAGKKVILANFSFTWLDQTSAELVFPYCYRIRANDVDRSGRNYFPEAHLQAWLERRGERVELYAFDRIGVQPLRAAYQYLLATHAIDTVVLVDGGTDSLMLGDEAGLGTPQEDVCSMAAVFQCAIDRQFLLSIGFGIDHFHGVSHYRFLENVAHLAREGAFLGSFHLIEEMEESQAFLAAVRYANDRMPQIQSIVANSITSALEGEYGNYHRTARTWGSELWINPLMTIYWAFELQKLVPQIKYYELIKSVNTIGEFNGQLARYRQSQSDLREHRPMPH